MRGRGRLRRCGNDRETTKVFRLERTVQPVLRPALLLPRCLFTSCTPSWDRGAVVGLCGTGSSRRLQGPSEWCAACPCPLQVHRVYSSTVQLNVQNIARRLGEFCNHPGSSSSSSFFAKAKEYFVSIHLAQKIRLPCPLAVRTERVHRMQGRNRAGKEKAA